MHSGSLAGYVLPMPAAIIPLAILTHLAPRAPSCRRPQVVLGDRDQNTTLARLQYYTRYLTQRDNRRQASGCRRGAFSGLLGVYSGAPASCTAYRMPGDPVLCCAAALCCTVLLSCAVAVCVMYFPSPAERRAQAAAHDGRNLRSGPPH